LPSARVACARTPWRRLPARGDAIDRKVVAGGTPRLGAELAWTPWRRLGDAMKTMGARKHKNRLLNKKLGKLGPDQETIYTNTQGPGQQGPWHLPLALGGIHL